MEQRPYNGYGGATLAAVALAASIMVAQACGQGSPPQGQAIVVGESLHQRVSVVTIDGCQYLSYS